MSVYTKTGDKGTTGLYTGQRVPKNSHRVKAYGTVDEISSALGMARAFCQNDEVKDIIFELQKNNNLLMADLASLDTEPMISDDHVARLEHIIDEVEAKLPPLNCFIIPGESQGGACLDMARTVTRRAERCVLDLAENELVYDSDRLYLNRLSDLCFVLMRLEENR
ncbi:MAG: cob(I)yrinic acid a,c-diamide adenosyltransferase [Anaerovibrio sp.]|uniref:cob(I)yrinic acid a,c-diamide adenosyltransferase n=1 Tax=uncultured Anaerovibrio sp. TaxID=361586 RepID=UPI0025F8C8E1|nr:cob(I)yrinic acid a,c-diamide adenosyltransferase [uncultured Anaerovibrio sp.]MBQ3853282.1 cob(I)yrinic acid a,c-diamide adenosyltransferase [Anaerovibrio sp.]